MGRVPSTETQLRNLKRELSREIDRANGFARDRDAYRARATRAEQEVAEWKNRFDALLMRTPTESARPEGEGRGE